MATRNCWHGGISATGTCETCKTFVTVTEGYRTEVTVIGSQTGESNKGLTGTLEFDAKPSAREALAASFGVGLEEVVIEDVLDEKDGWSRTSRVMFHIGTVRAPLLVSSIHTYDATRLDPARAEYDDEQQD